MGFSWTDRECLLTSQEIEPLCADTTDKQKKHIVMQRCHASARDPTLLAHNEVIYHYHTRSTACMLCLHGFTSSSHG